MRRETGNRPSRKPGQRPGDRLAVYPRHDRLPAGNVAGLFPKDHVEARLSVNVASLAGREDWIPVVLRQSADGFAAEPVFFKSNLIFNLASADGLMRIPATPTASALARRITGLPFIESSVSVYLHDIPLSEARAIFHQALMSAGYFGPLSSEEIPLDEAAAGRVLAEPIWARISSPHYHASAMDGFAVRADDTLGAAPVCSVFLKVAEQASYLDTGDPLPDWADAVIPIENVEPLAEDGQASRRPRRPASIQIRSAVTPWSHVRPMGEDIVATELILPAGKLLQPVDLGAIAAAGVSTPSGHPPAPSGDPSRRHRAGHRWQLAPTWRYHRVQFDRPGCPG